MSDLDQHLAGLDAILNVGADLDPPGTPDSSLPPPPESAINYKGPPGTWDGQMAREIGGSGDNMPNIGLRAAPRPAPLAILGGRGNAPLMMPHSPPESEADPSGSTYTDVGGDERAP